MIAISALFIVGMVSVFATQPATAAATVLNVSSGKWINQAHTNVEPITAYDIPNTQGSISASGIPNIDNCYLPAAIFRGYDRWDANGGYFNLQSYPMLSFDIWVDKVMQIEVGLVDTSNGDYTGGYSTLIADTYHEGQANTPPYNNLYGAGTEKSSDGAWLIMVGPSDGATTHYTIDLRTLGCNLGHIGQIVFDVTCGHQADIHWKISNVVLSSNGISESQPIITPTPTAAPTSTPKPTATPTPAPTATATPIPEPMATTAPASSEQTTIANPTPLPPDTLAMMPHPFQKPITNNPTSTPKPTATSTPQPTQTPTDNNPTPTPTPIKGNWFFDMFQRWFLWSGWPRLNVGFFHV